jgi:hypothetical protein
MSVWERHRLWLSRPFEEKTEITICNDPKMYVELRDQAVGRAVQRYPGLRFRGHGRQGLFVCLQTVTVIVALLGAGRGLLLHTWLSYPFHKQLEEYRLRLR